MYRAGKAAGKIIRKVIRLWDEMGLRRPIDSHILIGYSTGPDSTALAHLLVRYGRRLLDSQKVRLCYVAHPFRAQEIIQSEILHARMFAKKIGIPISICFMKTFTSLKKKSLENEARKERYTLLEKEAFLWGGENTILLTAHQAEDLAETVLWRLCTGTFYTHGGGILFQKGKCIRPFLKVKKEEILSYLKEENISYCQDQTNFETRFLRNKIRKELFPNLQMLFSKSVTHLGELGLSMQKKRYPPKNKITERYLDVPPDFEQAAAFFSSRELRKNHWKSIQKLRQSRVSQGSLDLPGKWKLSFERKKHQMRWIFEKKMKKNSMLEKKQKEG